MPVASVQRCADNVSVSKRKQLELARLFDETVLLYQRLSASAARFYGGGTISGPRRTVLVALSRSGAQSVAHLARTRAQSRQRLQPLVNALVKDGLVRATPNPMHKHSPLMVLTDKGQKAVEAIHRTEAEARARLQVKASADAIAGAADIVRQARLAIEHEWDALPRRKAGAS